VIKSSLSCSLSLFKACQQERPNFDINRNLKVILIKFNADDLAISSFLRVTCCWTAADICKTAIIIIVVISESLLCRRRCVMQVHRNERPSSAISTRLDDERSLRLTSRVAMVTGALTPKSTPVAWRHRKLVFPFSSAAAWPHGVEGRVEAGWREVQCGRRAFSRTPGTVDVRLDDTSIMRASGLADRRADVRASRHSRSARPRPSAIAVGGPTAAPRRTLLMSPWSTTGSARRELTSLPAQVRVAYGAASRCRRRWPENTAVAARFSRPWPGQV